MKEEHDQYLVCLQFVIGYIERNKKANQGQNDASRLIIARGRAHAFSLAQCPHPSQLFI